MGYTTFTGPIRAGNVLDTTGTTPGVSVSNVGQVVMAQRYPIVENGSVTTTICLPAYSQILSLTLYVNAAFTNSVSITDTTGATRYTNATAAATPASVVALAPATTTQMGNWFDIGSPDSQIVVAGGAVGGTGTGVLVVQYFQGPNGNA